MGDEDDGHRSGRQPPIPISLRLMVPKLKGKQSKTESIWSNPKAPEKSNHKFLGWFDAGDNPIDFTQAISVTPTDPPSDTEFTVNAKFE